MTSLRPSRATAKLCVWTLLCMCALPTWRPCTCTWKIFKRPRRGLKKASTRQLRAVPFTVFHTNSLLLGYSLRKKGLATLADRAPELCVQAPCPVSRLCVWALSGSCPPLVPWPHWPTLCPPLVLLLSSGRAGQPCVLLLSSSCPAVVLWPCWPTLYPLLVLHLFVLCCPHVLLPWCSSRCFARQGTTSLTD